MHAGMLWFDNSQTALDVKIKKAAEYYAKKYGRTPDLCLLHPSMIENKKYDDVAGVKIRVYRPVLPGHIWIGIEDEG